ncbi:MAG: type-F conjugative transfer system protein TraW [Azoarcus sp.]|jgi:conjugal transfer pilus assembly protein TraW|nr:type-F conjugative transfer system protein TraW [Azoarcus sp.]
MMPYWKRGGIAALLCLAPIAQAIDLGAIGPTYEIAEPHLLRMIEERLHAKAASGELARIESEAKRRGIEAVRNPAPVAGVRATTQPRSFYFDPTYTLDRNILGAKGELLFAAGTRKNPLEIVTLSKHLLFFDARDEKQVAQAAGLLERYRSRVKPILTGGSFLDLMKDWRRPVYYDQHGILTTKFGIRQVPALVSQEGMRLRIDELEIPQ